MPGVNLPTRGRAMTVKRGTGTPTLIAAVRTKSFTIAGEAINVTTDDDTGIQKLLDQPGELTVSISVSGIMKDETLITESLSTSDRTQATEFGWPGVTTPGKIAGEFYLSSFGVTGEYNGAATFEAEFQSAGPVVLTAAV